MWPTSERTVQNERARALDEQDSLRGALDQYMPGKSVADFLSTRATSTCLGWRSDAIVSRWSWLYPRTR
jgi:hypothetical protein